MHPECLEEKARAIMSRLGPTLGMHGGVLAGGSGLALHLGHRISSDLEFFAHQRFNMSEILEELRTLVGQVEPLMMDADVMAVRADGARLSLTMTPAHFGASRTRVNGCDVAGIADIAAMKLVAVTSGGTREDFVDLYAILQTVPFRNIARTAWENYGAAALEPLAVGKGLVWFEDADTQADPTYIATPIAWQRIKGFFRSSLRQFVFDMGSAGKEQ